MRTFVVTVLVLTVRLFVGLVLTEVVGIIGFLWLDSDRASEIGIGKIFGASVSYAPAAHS